MAPQPRISHSQIFNSQTFNSLAAVAAASTASLLFGAAVVATRYLVGAIDPLPLAMLRFALGCLLLTPFALSRLADKPGRIAARDLGAIALLGCLFYGLFPWLFSAGLHYIPSARGALWLATMPVLTFALSALLRYDSVSLQKLAGLACAGAGVAITLLDGGGFGSADPEAWRGDALLFGTALCGATYFVLSRPVLKRVTALNVSWIAMGAGSVCLALIGETTGMLSPDMSLLRMLLHLSGWQCAALVFLGSACGALAFFLWSWSLRNTTPTRTAVYLAINPISATLLGALLLDEGTGLSALLGLGCVICGIFLVNRPAAGAGPVRWFRLSRSYQ